MLPKIPFKIYIPIFRDFSHAMSFSAGCDNPGIGGTEFTSIKLAIFLAQRYPDLEVLLANEKYINIIDLPENLSMSAFGNLNEFLEYISNTDDPSIVLCTMALLEKTDLAVLRKLRSKLIVWLHHPFQINRTVRRLGFAAHVHVGGYQFFSNAPFYESNWHIQNIFTSSSYGPLRGLPTEDSPLKIVYLGALVRQKGFGVIARQWPQLKRVWPRVELHVIGSSLTYSALPENEFIPCNQKFAEEILSHIPKEDIEAGKVIFHGNLGSEKLDVMRSAHLAVLNPSGRTEAFPASPIECMACGLPVVASGDLGMSDSMRFLPELSVRGGHEIVDRVQWLISDQRRYEELSARCITIAKWFESQNEVTIIKWMRLFERVMNVGNQKVPDSPPVEGLLGSRFKLWYRQLRALPGAYTRILLGREGPR